MSDKEPTATSGYMLPSRSRFPAREYPKSLKLCSFPERTCDVTQHVNMSTAKFKSQIPKCFLTANQCMTVKF